MKIMKYICLFLLLAGLATAQTSTVMTNFTAAGSSIAIPASSILYHRLVISNASTTFTACTVAIDSSPDGTTWTAGGVLASTANNCLNTPRIEQLLPTNARFVRVTVTTLTGTGLNVNITYIGSNVPFPPEACTGTPVQITMSTATTTQFAALTIGVPIRVCKLNIDAAGSTTVTIVAGTGSNCGTGTTSISGPYTLTATGPAINLSGSPELFRLPAGQALCITNSAAIVIGGTLVFSKP